jgi:spoIIIJ-associated protein
VSEGVEASGRTVEEAIDRALEALGATEDEVEIQILSEGRPGGVFRRADEARVRARWRDERTAEDLALEDELDHGEELPAGAVIPETSVHQAEEAQAFLEGLLREMTLEGSVEAHPTQIGASVEISGDNMGLLIGKRGITLAAVQELTRAVVQQKTEGRAVVTVDIEGYYSRRRASLEHMARAAASRARKSRKPIALEPMTARDRKVIHDTLTNMPGITTASEGQEPHRHVVVRSARRD